MDRFFIFCLCCISLILPAYANAATKQMPMGAYEFLDALGDAPNSTDLYQFLDLYTDDFKACKSMDAYFKALSYLLDNGEKDAGRSYLLRIAGCKDLPENIQDWGAQLAERSNATEQWRKARGSITPAPVLTADTNKTVAAADPKQIPQVEKTTEQGVAVASQPAAEAIASKKQADLQQVALVKKTTVHSVSKRPKAPNQTAVAKSSATAVKPDKKKKIKKISPTNKVEPEYEIAFDTQNFYKDGDRETSRLFTSTETLSFTKGGLSLKGSMLYLTSFSGNQDDTDTGSSYLNKKPSKLRTNDTVFIPEISYETDKYLFSLGSSPIGGTVSPLPTGKLQYHGKNLLLAAYHESVTDSLLSYTGFKDVYSNKKMGRVMQAGAKIGWEDTFLQHWFYGLNTTGSYFHGKNVKENTAVKAEGYVGRNFGEVSIGFYSSIEHFATSLDNYTFGHGGYYSPHSNASGSVFASWKHDTKHSALKLDLSVGHTYEDIRSSRHYYRSRGTAEDYEGDHNNNFTFSTGLEWTLKISEATEFDFSANFLSSGKYFEGTGGLGLRINF